MTPRLRLNHITKAYPGIVANDDICLEVCPGEVLAILGENGAGKSTLMKIIFGSVTPDKGFIEFDGSPAPCRVIAGREAPLALPLGELSPKVTERALQALPIGSGHR